MQLGLTNAPAIFKRFINFVLVCLAFAEVLIYAKNVYVFAKTVDELFSRLRLVLEFFKTALLSGTPLK